MRLPLFQVDAFATRIFGGNPAAVMVMERFADDALLLALAAENNLSETAFLVPVGDDYRIRWFTPKVEVPLCGHATLAGAAVVMERLEPGRGAVSFQSASGSLPIARDGDIYTLDFPSRPSEILEGTDTVAAAVGTPVREVHVNRFNYMAVLDSAAGLRALKPDLAKVTALDRPGLIVTAPGDGEHDFLSRYFAPAKGIDEDPVTGAAHCMLAPYWAERLGRTNLLGFQASARGGEVACRLAGERVMLSGRCVFYLEGEVRL